MTTVRLAYHPEGQRGGALKKPEESYIGPSILVSYVYLDRFLAMKKDIWHDTWSLDSGAFSAHMSGTKIDIDKYLETCRKHLDTDPSLVEVFALDVIGDPITSRKNCEYMHKHDVPAIPTFHYGSPWDDLVSLCKEYPKVAIGGVARERPAKKNQFAEQVFARTWPHRLHGFGYGTEKMIMSFPWHSTDATSWELGPAAFGCWKGFGKMSVKGIKNLRSQVLWYMDLERKARARWAAVMKKEGFDDCRFGNRSIGHRLRWLKLQLEESCN
jgi:hypothetical protein